MRIDIWVQSAGLGHVTRQINLMGHLHERQDLLGVKPRFIVDANPATREAVARAGFDFVERDADDAAAFRALATEWGTSKPAAFILDSVDQDLNQNAHLVLADAGVFSVVIIDDPEDRDVECDLLINALPTSRPAAKKTKAKRAVRGVEYLILPAEYAAAREKNARRDLAECVSGFAFFGGADLEDFTSVFLHAIEKESPVKQWTLLAGPSYRNADKAAQRITERGLPVTMVRHVDSMRSALASAHVAVLAAGNTLSEAAAVGTPAIALSQNPVQADNAAFFAREAGVLDLGRLADDSGAKLASALKQLAGSAERRRTMSEKMMAVVDGLGGRRIAELLAGEIKVQR